MIGLRSTNTALASVWVAGVPSRIPDGRAVDARCDEQSAVSRLRHGIHISIAIR